MIDGLIEQNPYKFLPFHIGKGEKQYVDCVTEEQFAAIKKLKLSTPHILHARDLFLFQCYTGLAYSDLASFNYDSCEEIGGKMFYHAKRTKTDTDFVFQLLKPALEILQKYDFKLPKMSNQRYNDYLKAIGQMVGVDRLHTHMGRATAATLFLSKGMPINIVARVLGHTTLRQTARYARTLNKDVQSAFDALEGKMNTIRGVFAKKAPLYRISQQGFLSLSAIFSLMICFNSLTTHSCTSNFTFVFSSSAMYTIHSLPIP